MTRIRSSRGGFTAAELVITLSIVVALTSIASPSVLSALKRGQINGAANAILEVHREAQLLAQRNTAPGTIYGVLISREQGQTTATITTRRGGSAQELLDAQGRPVGRRLINPNVLVYTGSERRPISSVAWDFEAGTGAVLRPGSSVRSAIGLPVANTLAPEFGVCDVTGARPVAIRIFPEGLSDAHGH